MNFRSFVTLAISVVILCSCSSQKTSLNYFEDILALDSAEFTLNTSEFQIVPDDELLITVNSASPAATAYYNLPLINPATNGSVEINANPQQQTYLVNRDGDINFPQLGKIHVAGLTTQQLTNKLTEMISKDVIDPVVNVRLSGVRVNVLGEVNSPGIKGTSRERFTLLEAIAASGDLTPYGEREDIVLIREEDGKRTYHKLNLNSSKLLESPYFYLQQNDVIIVQPNKIRKDIAKYNQFNSYKLQVVSTIVSGCSIIASLIIALSVR